MYIRVDTSPTLPYNSITLTRTMESLEKHIEVDKKILEDPTISPQQRRHIEGELKELEVYSHNHRDEIEAGDHHDPTALELFCEMEPDADECRMYDD